MLNVVLVPRKVDKTICKQHFAIYYQHFPNFNSNETFLVNHSNLLKSLEDDNDNHIPPNQVAQYLTPIPKLSITTKFLTPTS